MSIDCLQHAARSPEPRMFGDTDCRMLNMWLPLFEVDW